MASLVNDSNANGHLVKSQQTNQKISLDCEMLGVVANTIHGQKLHSINHESLIFAQGLADSAGFAIIAYQRINAEPQARPPPIASIITR